MSEKEKGITLADIVISTAIATAGILAMRWILKPGNANLVHMRIALVTKRIAQDQADYWQIVAGNAANRYNELRNISV